MSTPIVDGKNNVFKLRLSTPIVDRKHSPFQVLGGFESYGSQLWQVTGTSTVTVLRVLLARKTTDSHCTKNEVFDRGFLQ